MDGIVPFNITAAMARNAILPSVSRANFAAGEYCLMVRYMPPAAASAITPTKPTFKKERRETMVIILSKMRVLQCNSSDIIAMKAK
ncbi:MAG TPA: hypothetical protein VJ577_09150 [Burkholderiaceae bacterium]|nr:hypothetical protein [Burkholderiaceae bacterium]